MKNDRTVKFLLAIIALGLWMNLFSSLLRPPITVKAGGEDTSYDVGQIAYHLGEIHSDLAAIKDGGANCRNTKICD